MYCSKCGAQLDAEARFCTNCGAQTAPAPTGATGGASAVGVPPAVTLPGVAAGSTARYAHLSLYWQAVFQKFDQRPGQMQTHWNWPSFFFGAFWYLVKGMPAKAALYFILSVLTYGGGWVFLAIYAGLYGAWDYYLKEVQGKQLW